MDRRTSSKTIKKPIFVAGSVLLALIGIAVVSGVSVWGAEYKPLYEPGMVRAERNLRAPLVPPAQTGDPNFWVMEPDIKLYHFAVGKGRTALVVHGGPGRPHLKPWAGLEALTNSCRFIYYDQRGCGRSTRPIDRLEPRNYYQNVLLVDRTLGLGAQIADIERIRRILGEEKLILIGHSLGGFLTALYAAEFPEHVAAMVLIAPADVLVAPNTSGGLFEEVKARLPEDQRGEYNAWLQRYFDFGGIFSKSEADLVALNDEFGRYYRMVTSTAFPEQGKVGGWTSHAIYFSMGQQHDYRQVLKNVSAPVLVIHGAKDLQPEEASRSYATVFANAKFRIIDNAEHFPFHTQPTEFAAVVAEFLAGLLQR
jgi:proline iminopeptidase